MGLLAGVDLGGTKIQTVVLDGERVAGSARLATPGSGAADVIAAIARSVESSLAEAGATRSALAGVGVGSPGAIDESGAVADSPNVHGFEAGPVPLASELRSLLGGVEVRVDNDVRAALLGEWRRGAGRPFRNLLGVFVGTGVGGGAILDGELRQGRGAAGEIGHTVVKPGGRRCGCGLRGHLEAYAGRRGIETTARRWQARGRHTRLFEIMERRGRPCVTSGVIAEAIERRDQVTVKLLDGAVRALGIAIANAQNLLDVEAVIIGGGLGDRLGRPFVERVAATARPLLHISERPPQFLTTELGDLSGAVGAALLAADRAPAEAADPPPGRRTGGRAAASRGSPSPT
jgi:glucokinase